MSTVTDVTPPVFDPDVDQGFAGQEADNAEYWMSNALEDTADADSDSAEGDDVLADMDSEDVDTDEVAAEMDAQAADAAEDDVADEQDALASDGTVT